MIKIYLTGALQGRGAEAFNAMKMLAEKLTSENYEVRWPYYRLEYANLEVFTLKEMMSTRLDMLLESDIVITTDDFTSDPFSELEVHVARKMEMEIIPITKWTYERKTTSTNE